MMSSAFTNSTRDNDDLSNISPSSAEPPLTPGTTALSVSSRQSGRFFIFIAAFIFMAKAIIDNGLNAETIDLEETSRIRFVNHTLKVSSTKKTASTINEQNFLGTSQSSRLANDDPSAPVLVLHIGPHKTGSSTIQCDLTFFRGPLYDEASVAFLGRGYKHCKDEHSREDFTFDTRDVINQCQETALCNETESWKMLEKNLRHLSKRNVSAIISDEAFSRMKIRASEEEDGVAENFHMLYTLFNKYYPGQVHVVIVYRWYFELHLSRWNEGNKPYSNKGHWYDSEYRAWPSDGGKTPQIFPEYYKDHVQNISQWVEMEQINGENKSDYVTLADLDDMHPVEYLQRLWSNYSSSVKILDFHEMAALSKNDDRPGEDMLTYFLGYVLPLAKNKILELKRKGVGEDNGRPNPSQNLDYDLLAIKAYEKGLLPRSRGEKERTTSLRRAFVAKTAEEKLLTYLGSVDPTSNLTSNLPMTCLTDSQLQWFLQKSLEHESRVRIIMGEHLNEAELEQQKQIVESAFWEAVRKNKFCNIDVDRLTENSYVQEFFRGMKW